MMIIPSNIPAISIAGTSHAASKVSAADDAAIHASQQAESAAKGSSDKTNATLETEGSQDRGGDGRQVLDVFERREKKQPPQEEIADESAEDESDSTQKPSEPIKRLDITI
jgi:hypothetical protein